jgi:hypothetical protein
MGENTPGFFEKPATIRVLWIMLYAVCGLTLVPELFIQRHAYFGIDHFFSFFAILGFIACALLILFAKGLGFILKKEEGYYDE